MLPISPQISIEQSIFKKSRNNQRWLSNANGSKLRDFVALLSLALSLCYRSVIALLSLCQGTSSTTVGTQRLDFNQRSHIPMRTTALTGGLSLRIYWLRSRNDSMSFLSWRTIWAGGTWGATVKQRSPLPTSINSPKKGCVLLGTTAGPQYVPPLDVSS
jgi:hypothetical protein